MKKILLIFISFFCAFALTNVAKASSQKVLIVYDSKNEQNHGTDKIDSLKRFFISSHFQVSTKSMVDYQKGDLNDSYQGIITMINWPAANLKSASFNQDLNQFKGKKIHIGPNLSKAELSDLKAQSQNVYSNHVKLKINDNEQPLKGNTALTVLRNVSNDAKKIGQYQSGNDEYNAGIIEGQAAFLPNFETGGLSYIIGTKLIAQLFGISQDQKPFLFLRDVTPYSSSKYLLAISKFCLKKHMPLIISMTANANNTDVKSYLKLTETLRTLEQQGTLIFVQTPIIGAATSRDGNVLNNNFDNAILHLAQQQVYPIGISAPSFWSEDQVLYQNGLKKSDAWLLLSNNSHSAVKPNDTKEEREQYLETHDAVNYLKPVSQSYLNKWSATGVPALSFKSVDNLNTLRFSSPTAVTLTMPQSKNDLNRVKHQIKQLHFAYDDFNNFKSNTVAGSTLLQYQDRHYLVNQKEEIIHNNAQTKIIKKLTYHPILSSFFKTQETVLIYLLSIILIGLLILLWTGLKIYRENYHRK